MKLRGANGRLRPWASHTSRHRSRRTPSTTTAGCASDRSYSRKLTCGARRARAILRASKPRTSGATSLSLPLPSTTSNRRPRGSGKIPGRRRASGTDVVQSSVGRGLRDLHRSGDHLQRLRNRLRLLRVRAGVLRGEGLRVRSEALLLVPRPASRCRAVAASSYGDGGGYGGGGVLARPARDARRGLRSLRQRDPGAVPPDRGATGLLLRLLPDDARTRPRPIRDADDGRSLRGAARHCAAWLGRPAAVSVRASVSCEPTLNSADNLRSLLT